MSRLHYIHYLILSFFFFNATATTEIYTLSLHDALPIWHREESRRIWRWVWGGDKPVAEIPIGYVTNGVHLSTWMARPLRELLGEALGPDWESEADSAARSEEHTSELQSPDHLVCRLLLEKKKTPVI